MRTVKDKQASDDGKALEALFTAVAVLRDADEAEAFLADLCTPAELEALAGRWQVARLIERKLPYRTIYARTGVSTATVTRVARALRHGESGYRLVLNRLEGKKGVS